MKLLVILVSVLAISVGEPSYGYNGPPAPLAHDGTVLDTPEVAHAKAAHLAAHAAASARAHGHNYDHGVYGYNEEAGAVYEGAPHSAPQTHGYQGPYAPLAHDGRVLDTPEVAHAKAAHLAAHAHAAARVSHYGSYENNGAYVPSHGYAAIPVQVAYAHAAPVGYHGPPAPLGHDGRVIDTPEVAHAKAAHLQAYAHAAALAAAHQDHSTAETPSSHESSASAEGPSQEESYYY